MEERIKDSIKEVKEDVKEIKEEVKKEISDVKSDKQNTAGIKAEFTKTKDDLQLEITESKRRSERAEMTQYRATENFLHFRGIEEEEDEQIRGRMIETLAEFLQQEPERVEDKVDLIYRVQSPYDQSKTSQEM